MQWCKYRELLAAFFCLFCIYGYQNSTEIIIVDQVITLIIIIAWLTLLLLIRIISTTTNRDDTKIMLVNSTCHYFTKTIFN